jgi:hypothetical protein
MNPVSHLSVAQYNMIIAIVIMHEMLHAFTKYLFNNIITSEGVGPTRNGCGESGWLVERQMMGGTILASWNREADVGRMEAIDGVVLETDGSSHIIGKVFPCIIPS